MNDHDRPTTKTAARGYHPRANLTGRRFGRLTVTGYIAPAPYTRRAMTGLWACRCDCGRECAAKAPQLLRGHTRSCGCLRRETSAKAARELNKRRRNR